MYNRERAFWRGSEPGGITVFAAWKPHRIMTGTLANAAVAEVSVWMYNSEPAEAQQLEPHSDASVEDALRGALGTVGGPRAARLLREGPSQVRAPVLPVAADGRMASRRAEALETYNALNAATMPKVVRRAASRELNAAAREMEAGHARRFLIISRRKQW